MTLQWKEPSGWKRCFRLFDANTQQVFGDVEKTGEMWYATRFGSGTVGWFLTEEAAKTALEAAVRKEGA